MLRTIDRYVLREIVPPTILALLIFTFILEIPPLMDVAEKLIAKGVSAATIMRIMVTLLPQALGVTIPMALLVGLLMGLGRLSGDREAVALQACGVSLYRLLAPALVLGLAGWAATAYVMVVALPDANQAFREITYNIIAARAESEVKPRVFFEDFPNMLLYVRDVPTDGTGWTDVFLADTTNAVQPDVYVAARGRMVLDREHRRVEVLLEDGTRHRVNPDAPDTYEVFEFDQLSFALDPETVFPQSGPQRGARELSIGELRAEASRLVDAGLPYHRPILELHKKFSIPVACLVFAVLGLALGVTNRKDSKLASFVLGIGVIFVYYIIMYVGESLAKGGLVSAHLAMWLPNIVLGLSGVGLLLERSRGDRGGRISIALPWPWRRHRSEPEGPAAGSARSATRTGSAPRSGVVVVVRIPHIEWPGWNLLDGYVLGVYGRIVGLAMVGLLGIFHIATFIDLSDKLFKGETTSGVLAQYLWFATPQFLYYIIPISALIGTLVTIGLLTKSSELVVMKACGVSLYRVALPLLALGVAWSAVLFGLEESILGRSNRRADQIRHVIRGGSPRTFDVLNRKWLIGKNGNIYHYLYYDPSAIELNGLSVYDLDDEWQLARRTYAAQVVFRDTEWQASRGWVRELGPRTAPARYEHFEASVLPLEAPDYFMTEHPDAERMTYPQLQRYIVDLQAGGFNVIPHLVALQRKVAFPFVTIVMTLLAVPFAVTTGSRGTLYGVGIGVVLAIGYWIIISIFGAIGNAGLLAPMLAAWGPNVLFGAGAAYLLLGVRT